MILIKYFIFFAIIFNSAFSAEVILTKNEKDWIKKSSSIRLGADYKWPPFDFADSNGVHSELSAEYLKLISKKTGLEFDVVTGKWSDIIENMKNKKYDGLTCSVKTDERKKYLMFTDNYLSVPMVIITKEENENIKDINDLNGKSVSINKGSYVHEWLKENHPEIKLHLTTSNAASMEAVSVGDTDAYIGNLAVSRYLMNKYLISNLKFVSKLKDLRTEVSIAVDKDNVMLFNIIQKALHSISPSEHQKIKSKLKESLSINKKDLLLSYTDKQQDWINKHKIIRYVIDNEWRPIEYFSNIKKEHEGISRSYIDMISNKTGIKFELIHTNSWEDSNKLINNRKADLYTAVAKTRSREKVLNFSLPYIDLPQVFVTKKNVDYITSMEKLFGKKVVLVKGYYVTEIIRREFPQIEIIEVNSVIEAFEHITENRAFAYIDILPTVSYYIQQNGYSNLKISGTTKYNPKFSIALRNDWEKEGIEVINKALKSITEEEKNNIYNKWLHVEYDKNIDYTLLWQIIGLFIFFLAGTLYWNRILAVEIEKRKLAQKELFELNQKLEEATQIAQSANKAKSDFLSNMSHEIRTPMNSILGFSELLDEKIEDKKLKSFIKTIRNSGETLLHLINDILDLSKIESGKLELTKSAVNIKNIFEETINIFQYQAQKKRIELILNLDKKMPKALLLDAIRIKEILINLIGNALKFTEYGQIQIKVIVDEVHEHTSKIDLRVIVKDEGIGISKENQARIFNIFEQSENQDIKKYGGTGLGLAISKNLANLMNGTLEVESKLGVGSSFILTLKNVDIASLNDEDLFSEVDIDSAIIKFEKSTILVADDIKENRDLIRESFLLSNINVLEATNGKEAIEILKSNKVDLVLMDIRMPILDGYEATNMIREFSDIPIVALTASVMQEEIKKLKGENFNGYLRKPISKNELFKEMTNYLKFNTNTVEEKEEIEEEIIIKNEKEFVEFFDILSTKLNANCEYAIATNDISIIKNFASSLLDLSIKYKVKYVTDYASLLLEKIDMFDINAISEILEDYKNLVKKLKSKIA